MRLIQLLYTYKTYYETYTIRRIHATIYYTVRLYYLDYTTRLTKRLILYIV